MGFRLGGQNNIFEVLQKFGNLFNSLKKKKTIFSDGIKTSITGQREQQKQMISYRCNCKFTVVFNL